MQNYREWVVVPLARAKDDAKGTRTLSMCWFFPKRSFAISGALAQLYSDVINDLKSNSNLHCGVELGFDEWSVVFCDVAEWCLCGFVRGFVLGGDRHWQKISANTLIELESIGRLEEK